LSVRGASLAIVLLALTAVACEEENTSLVTDIGTVGFVVTDPGRAPQVVSVGLPPVTTIQAIEWVFQAPADLVRQDGTTYDLFFREGCSFVQTVKTEGQFNPVGRCAEGIILGSTDDLGGVSPPGQLPVTLSLRLTAMTVRSAKPLELPPDADYESDGVVNAQDNCPLRPNRDQADSNGDGVGDLCEVRDFFGNVVPDNDGDGVADSTDNCVWYPNPGQEDTTGLAADPPGIPDGIGDACTEQIAEVRMIPEELNFEFTVGLATGGISLVTVDFDDRVALENCKWTPPGSCDLVPSEIQACGIESSVALALLGCPNGS
jgi:hypothetical protein